MILQGKIRRACIYFIYDKDGIIDDYIIYQLSDMRKNVDFLHCVINGKLTASGRKRLEAVADEVYVRENKGIDIGAYKAALEYIGWEEIKKYDELVLMNNTCFGPIYPFKECFDWAAKQDIEMWALTHGTKTNWLGTNDYLHYNKKEIHYQSFFYVIRKPLLGSSLLIDFFREIPDDLDYIHSGSVYEYAFPGYFEERGFKGAVYCPDDDYDYPLIHNAVHILRDYRMPLFKKRSFFHQYNDVMYHTIGEMTVNLIRFIENETDYDMNMVWDSILRTNNLADIVRCAQLNRVLPRNIVSSDLKSNQKVGFVFHAYYEDLFEESVAFANCFPPDTDVLFTTDTPQKLNTLKKLFDQNHRRVELVLTENRGRDVSALLVGAAKFVSEHDLICFAHDKKTEKVMPLTVGKAWALKLHENVMGSPEFVKNVIDLFEREKRLGIAFPSPPNHSHYALSIGNGWIDNYWNVQRLLGSFGVSLKMNEHTLCVAPLGTCFWFRTKALKRLFEGYTGNGWSYKDFPCEPNRCDQTILHAIERAYAYFAQGAGYYPAYLYNDKMTEIELTNLEFNKTGSADMRMWVERLTLEAIGYSGRQAIALCEQGGVQQYPDQHVNYGVKRSLVHLATALRYKFPKLWKLMLPIRRIGQKIFGIKTK